MAPTEELSYYEQRMQLLGITAAANRVKLWRTDTKTLKEELEEVPIFSETDEGIKILGYTLGRTTIRIEKQGSKQKIDWAIVRLEKPLQKGNDVMKYRLPKGGGNYPFFPPSLIDKFENKTPIDTLFLVEGFFKAFKASMHGADIIGLSSITHMKDKEKGSLHLEIIDLIKACTPKRIVWLTDGDCLDITSKELSDGVDLFKRPNGFFKSVETFKNLLDDYKDVEKWFVHIDIDTIISNNSGITRDQVKGIDDLLVTFSGKENNIITDMLAVSQNSAYFRKFNITYGINKVWHHFHLNTVKDFYLFHIDRRPELKNLEFKFIGTLYKYDEEKQECIVVSPSAAKDYFRVGDGYYKFVHTPNKYNQLERRFVARQKGTIQDDHGKNFIKHIAKYEGFCNVPKHVNYQQIISSHFNMYNPIDHEPDESPCKEEDCPTIIKFVQHIFGINEITIKRNNEDERVKYYELGLDFMQLLYINPTQKLPILCLVSKENETGKSTFAMLLKNIFTSNVAIVGNADLADNFNAHWASKLLVICDETKIDKQSVVERVKSLSTADKIMMNAKGKDHAEIDFFGKFMFLTNNEENFIYASDEDLRYWVIKVPRIQEKNPNLMEQMIDEIPAFLSFLNNRKMVTDKVTRMWFDPALLKTEALKKVIEHSKPTIEKELREHLREMFFDFGVEEITMSRRDVHKEIFNNRFEANYLQAVLRDRLNVDIYHKWAVNEKEFDTQAEAEEYASKNSHAECLLTAQKVYKSIRYSYPRIEIDYNKKESVRVDVKQNGRPYVFYRSAFISDDEWNKHKPSDENKFVNDMTAKPDELNGHRPDLFSNNSGAVDDLPF